MSGLQLLPFLSYYGKTNRGFGGQITHPSPVPISTTQINLIYIEKILFHWTFNVTPSPSQIPSVLHQLTSVKNET